MAAPGSPTLLSLKRSSGVSSKSSNSSEHQQDLLMCDVCLEPYNDAGHEAKFLACHHSFCLACLTKLAANGAHIECPTCRHQSPIPEGGPSALQTNFYLAYMRETFGKLGAPKVKGCQKHSNQPMSFFCKKCGMAICRDCTVLDHKDSDGHTIQDITAAEVEQRKALSDKMGSGSDTLGKLQEHMGQLEAEISNLTIAKDVVLKELDIVFDRCSKMLEYRKMQLAKSVFDQYARKQELLLKRGEDVSAKIKQLMQLVGKCQQLATQGSLSEVVSVNKNLSTTVENSTDKLKNIDLGKNYLLFDGSNGRTTFEDSICKLGQVLADGYLPTSARFKPKELISALKSQVVMEVCSHKGEKLPKYPITVQITDPQNTHLSNAISANENGEYIVTFVPQMSGEHTLVPVFLGHPIKGAEATVTVQSNNHVAKFGEQGNGYGKFLSPRAVGIDKDNSLYIADTGNRLIQKLDKNGKFLNQFCVNNNKENCSTCDLALNREKGLIICTETLIGSGINPTMGNNVLVYNREGAIQDIFSNKVMKCALCIATNSKGDIIVSDYLVHSLFMYDSSGNFLRRVGHAGTFNHPAFICIAEDDSIIVSDTNNDCVQIFNTEGKFIRQFGASGSGKGELKQPFGVATDGENILVVDSGNKRIQVYKKDGTFVSMIESKDEPFDQPRGIAVTTDNYLYVADRDNHCVKKFKYQ